MEFQGKKVLESFPAEKLQIPTGTQRKKKKNVARKSKDRVSSDCTQGSFTSN